LNSFCKDCEHKNVPAIFKEKYNTSVNKFFIECPLHDEKVVYCFNKNFNIKWQEFYEWLVSKGMLSKNEREFLEANEWKISS